MRSRQKKLVSASEAFLAVLAAFRTQKGAGYSSTVVKQLNEATFSQTAASDEWAFFHAKGIKQSIAEQEKERLARQGDAVGLKAITDRIERYD